MSALAGFTLFRIVYEFECEACGVKHVSGFVGRRGTPIPVPEAPDGWTIASNAQNIADLVTYCPAHKVTLVVEDKDS